MNKAFTLVKERHWDTLWDLVSVWVVVGLGLALIGGVGWGVWSQNQAANSSALAASYGMQNKALLKHIVTIDNNHHTSSLAKDNYIAGLVKSVLAAQADHAKTLQQVATLQFEVGAELATLPAKEDYIRSLVIVLIKDVNNICTTVPGCTALPVPAS